MQLIKSIKITIIVIFFIFININVVLANGKSMLRPAYSRGTGLVTIHIQNIPVRDAILLVAKSLQLNVIVSPTVNGTTSLSLTNAKPQHALNLLLRANNLGKLEIENIWFVAPYDELLKRKQAEIQLVEMQEKASRLITMTQQVKFGSAQDIANILQDGHAALISKRGSIKVDKRSNIIAIQDISERLIAIKKLIKQFDVPSKQVLIEARIASVDSDCERELGIRYDVLPGKEALGSYGQEGRYSLAVARLADGSMLDVKLSALEKRGQAELISSPSLSTSNQQPASIEAGEEVPYQQESESGGTAVTFKKAVLGLKVTAQILPNAKVLLKLQINQDRPSNKLVQGVPTINTRQIVTNVLAKNGQTIVLGGIYETNHENGMTGVPFLHEIPVIGWLFKEKNNRVNKRELLIFVTPKIAT